MLPGPDALDVVLCASVLVTLAELVDIEVVEVTVLLELVINSSGLSLLVGMLLVVVVVRDTKVVVEDRDTAEVVGERDTMVVVEDRDNGEVLGE